MQFCVLSIWISTNTKKQVLAGKPCLSDFGSINNFRIENEEESKSVPYPHVLSSSPRFLPIPTHQQTSHSPRAFL